MIGALGEVEVLSFDGPSVGVCVRESWEWGLRGMFLISHVHRRWMYHNLCAQERVTLL